MSKTQANFKLKYFHVDMICRKITMGKLLGDLHTHLITGITSNVWERSGVGSALVSLLLAGSPSHDDNVLCINIDMTYCYWLAYSLTVIRWYCCCVMMGCHLLSSDVILWRATSPDRWHRRLSLLGSSSVRSQTLIARFMGPTWDPSGAHRAQVGPMLAPWTLLSGKWHLFDISLIIHKYCSIRYIFIQLDIHLIQLMIALNFSHIETVSPSVRDW